MANSRSNSYGETASKVVDFVFQALTYSSVALLLLSYLSPHINPNQIVWFSFLGLIAPGLYVVNLILMLYWVIRWRGVALVLAITLLIGVGNIGKYFKPQISKDYTYQRPSGSIRVLSYNVCGFIGQRDGKTINSMDEITSYINEVNPDIICMQEFAVNHIHPRAQFDNKLTDWKHRSIVYAIGDASNGIGLAIYSKYPIKNVGQIQFQNSSNSSMWVDVIVRRDTIRLYNNHLQTTEIDLEDKDFIEGEILTNASRTSKIKGIARKLKRNFEKRSVQADSVSRYIHDGNHRVVVCGDFNDTPMSYTYNKMRGSLVDAFKAKGRGVIYTYKGFFGVLRIDYIFHSRDFETLSYESSYHELSDHNPVMVDIKFKNK